MKALSKFTVARMFYAIGLGTCCLAPACAYAGETATSAIDANKTPAPVIPSFAELEKSGAVVGKIIINAQNIFDLADPQETNLLFRTANKLHVQTRPAVISRVLLFGTGERVSVQKIEETERLLRKNRYLYDAQIRPVTYVDGTVDIEVSTRDTWTLDVAGSYSRSGGNNKTSIGIKDYNIGGTGLRLGYAHTSDIDRKGTVLDVEYAQAFDGWTQLSLARGKFDDGKRTDAAVVRPFYALDTHWAAGGTWTNDDRIDSIYNAGETVAQYRHHQKTGELFGGLSPGLVKGWTHRYNMGALVIDDDYLTEPGRQAPSLLPAKQKLRGLFLRLEVIEDQFAKLKNRDQIQRAEFFNFGFASRFQLTRAMTGMGATQNTWLYALVLSHGSTSEKTGHNLFLTAETERRIASTGTLLTQIGATARYYLPLGPRALFFASLSADRITSGGGDADQLLLGGNNGLRGFPTKYQVGEKRALTSVEQRVYSDWYPFRLVRVGGAVFADYGRAWQGPNANASSSRWLADAGVGLRLALDRSAFSNVLHIDLAKPINPPPGIKSVQYLVKTELTF